MIFQSQLSERLKKVLSILKRKNHSLFTAVEKKMWQIANSDVISIQHFKNLKGNMSHLKRAHISHFVLTFQVIEDRIIFEDFAYHDNAYSLSC